MYRFCCKTWNYSVLSASTSCNLQLKDLLRDNLVPRVLSYELGCKTGLRWLVKAQPRYSTRFAAMLQNKLEQVLFNIFWSKFLRKTKTKERRKNKERQEKEKYQQLSCCMPWRHITLHLIRYEQTIATSETRNFAKTSGAVTRDREKNWPIADWRVPSNDPRINCGTHLGSSLLLVSKVANDILCLGSTSPLY